MEDDRNDKGPPLGGDYLEPERWARYNRVDRNGTKQAWDEVATDSDGGLDTEHHARIVMVGACDSARARRHAAEAEIARLVEEEQILRAERQALGGNEHVDAIMRSGWFPYAGPILSSARLAWILDAVLWTALWLGVWVLAFRAFSHE